MLINFQFKSLNIIEEKINQMEIDWNKNMYNNIIIYYSHL